MMKLTEKGTLAMNLIKQSGMGKFSAKSLSAKVGQTISPQTLSALAKKGCLLKIEGTSPVEYQVIGDFDYKKMGVSGASENGNRYGQYKNVIAEIIISKVGNASPENYEFMATLRGKAVEIAKVDLTGKNFPRTQCIFLDKIVDDKEAFAQAWKELIQYELVIID